ncbi:hypothetical protein FRC12_022075 [Ceratobasidium sp. 428]|nr:hypothetical protein FRC12_022075 [Ceratobasidium sp. 428]
MFWWFKPSQWAQRRAALRQAQRSELVEEGPYHEPVPRHHAPERSTSAPDKISSRDGLPVMSKQTLAPAQDVPVVGSINVNHPITKDLLPLDSTNMKVPTKKEPLPAKPPNDPTDDEDLEFLKGIGREAQVWKTYVEETKDFDDDMVDGWNRSLDVTLVFAALFSAILTGFVLESAKKLEPDKADQTVAILREISQTLQANGAQTQIAGRSGFAVNDESFQPTTSAVWINCLWFLSLSLSIAVSLAAMLAKQWCYYYVSARNGDTITQAEERQQRFSGLASWRMRGILEHLPMLMHILLGQ